MYVVVFFSFFFFVYQHDIINIFFFKKIRVFLLHPLIQFYNMLVDYNYYIEEGDFSFIIIIVNWLCNYWIASMVIQCMFKRYTCVWGGYRYIHLGMLCN